MAGWRHGVDHGQRDAVPGQPVRGERRRRCLRGHRLLDQIEVQLAERGALLIFSDVPKSLPTGQDLLAYFDDLGLVRPERKVRVFNQLSDALEWAEDQTLQDEGHVRKEEEALLDLRAIDFLKGRKEDTIKELLACVVEKTYRAGERIFAQGDSGDEIFFIRRGSVRIVLRLAHGEEYHLATFTRGDHFGEMAFLDRGTRSAGAVAATPTDLYLLSRERFERVAACLRLSGTRKKGVGIPPEYSASLCLRK